MVKKKINKKSSTKKVSKKKKEKTEINDPIIKFIDKEYGTGKIFKLPGKDEGYDPKDFISTGSLCLNFIISGDYKCGIPRKKPIEIYGPESVGKTTVALHIALEASLRALKSLCCDQERGLNEFYARNLGIDRNYFYYFQPDFGEEGFEMTEKLLNKFPWDLYIYDSIGGMRTRAIMQGDWTEANMGSGARLMSKAIGRLGPAFRKYNIAPIFINQMRSKIGGYGNPEDTPGGKAVKFQEWVRLEIRAPRSGKVETKILTKGMRDLKDVIDSEEIKKIKESKKKKKKGKRIETGTIVNVKTIKNKLFMPRRTCRIKINYGVGFDRDFDLLEFLNMQEIINQKSKSKLIYDRKEVTNKKFLRMYKTDKGFKKEIVEIMEKKRKEIMLVTEDKNFAD